MGSATKPKSNRFIYGPGDGPLVVVRTNAGDRPPDEVPKGVFYLDMRSKKKKKVSKAARSGKVTALSRAVSPRVAPLSSKLHSHMRVIAQELANKLESRKAKKLSKQDSYGRLVAELADTYRIRVAADVTEDTIKVMPLIVQTIRDLCDCGAPVAKAISSSRLIDITLDPGPHIKEPDVDNPTICNPSHAYADYEVDSASLRIAAGLDLEELHQKYPQVGTGEHNVGTDFRTVLAHELGHAVMQDCEDAAREKFQITYESRPKEYWESRVSKYAGSSDRELFAECFSAYTHGKYEDNLPPEVVDFFNRAGLKSNVRSLAKAAPQDLLAEFEDLFDSLDWSAAEESMIDDLRQAFVEAATAEYNAVAVSFDTEQVNQDAVEYAKERAAETITDIAETTRNSIQADIVDALEEGTTSQELMGELIDSYSFSPDRAERIARTELATANVQGHVNASQGAGATGKIWLLSNDHDDSANCNCTDNAEEGEIPFEDDWSSGDDWPPAHPNCMCDFAAVYPDDGADADTEKFEKAEGYSPPAGVRSAAKRGLALRQKWGRGGLSTSQASSQGIGSGVARATTLKQGKKIPLKTIERMNAFFSRHQKNYNPKKKMPDGGPTAGTIAWLLWGGNAGKRWAASIVNSEKG